MTLESAIDSISKDLNLILTSDMGNMLLFCTYAIGISGIKKTPEILKE
jgi:hypothetical protein